MNTNIDRDDVLFSFAVEADHKRAFKRYLKKYPQFAVDLALLSFELKKPVEPPRPISDRDRAFIDEAWERFKAVISPPS